MKPKELSDITLILFELFQKQEIREKMNDVMCQQLADIYKSNMTYHREAYYCYLAPNYISKKIQQMISDIQELCDIFGIVVYIKPLNKDNYDAWRLMHSEKSYTEYWLNGVNITKLLCYGINYKP